MAADDGGGCAVLVVGNGPSALALSFLLSGHEPQYNGTHSDPRVHSMMEKTPSLYDAVLHNLSLHRHIAQTQTGAASPINGFLDSLAAPGIDFDPAGNQPLLSYKKRSAIPHLVVGSTFSAGGQWAGKDSPSQTLSYAEMLSLPGYSFSQFVVETRGTPIDPYTRPSRADVAAYYALYPSKVGISEFVRANCTVLSLRRRESQFFTVTLQNNDTGSLTVITTRAIVLATGVFTHLVPPDPILHPLMSWQQQQTNNKTHTSDSVDDDDPILVVGSGFSAADAVLSIPRNRKVIHLYKWDPLTRPSPLRACHRETYPEYASLYRLMRRSASGQSVLSAHHKPTLDPVGLCGRYEGLPNCRVVEVPSVDTVRIQLASGATVERKISRLKTYVGRLGVISYLSADLRNEIGVGADQIWVSKHTLLYRISSRNDRWTALKDSEKGWRIEETRHSLDTQAELEEDRCDIVSDYAATHGLELTNGVFVIGSLVGDSLVRYALGGCVTVAGHLFERFEAMTCE
ncbi:hypothetical protein BZA70DRAFT_297887 [Myxozyma melibiosi]|uniref:L-ornithine N(5)-monooxygenase [NAD(P)H] n=1 Tax=Myxozyma melibiosi TaxID=54550 RepID=A0ABR1EYK6_9ASCO